MSTREKKLKAIRGNGYHFVPKGGAFPTENHHACCEKLWFVRSLYPNLPLMQNFYHGMLMPLHDSMPSFMNFRRVLDFLEFNPGISMFSVEWRRLGVWTSFPFVAWDLSMHLRKKFDFSTNLYALEHVHVVQILIVHINALKTHLMHKNVQMNTE